MQVGTAEILNIPSLAIDQTNGKLYVAYMDFLSPTSNYSRIKFIRSTNDGTSWSTPITISDLGVSTDKQYFPWVSVDDYGRISVLFVNYSSPNSDTYITDSYDGGISFRSPIKITSQGSDPHDGHMPHHYHGISNVGNGYSYSIWNDYRNSNTNPYFSKVNPHPLAPTGFYITGGIGENPTLHWDPNVELDLDGYKIYCSHDQAPWYLLTTVDKNTTSFTDPGVTITGGKFDPIVCYNISAFDIAGNESEQHWRSRCVTSNEINKEVVSDNENISNFRFYLFEAFPNPFNPTTKIKYSLSKNGFVTLRVLDVLGNVVTKLIEEEKSAGEYSVYFDASNLPSGIYFYRMTSGKFSTTKKLILLK